MRYFLLFIVFVSYPFSAKADTIKECFKEETDSAISMCLSSVYQELEDIRNTIEADMVLMILDDVYLPPPEIETEDENDTSFGLSSNVREPKTPSDIRAKKNFDEAMARLEIQRAEEKARQTKNLSASHELEKRRLLENQEKTKELFEEYRETECKRRRESVQKSENLFEPVYVYKLCLYEMTKTRIEHLHKAVKQW